MARGFAGVRGVSDEIEARKNSGGSGGKLFFKLASGEFADVRFLEQGEDVRWARVHELPPADNRPVGNKVPCRQYDSEGLYTGEDCPGCEKQLPRKFQGAINVIWRDAPVYARDDQGKLIKENGRAKVIGTKDQVALWAQGINVFNELDETDATYKGLSSRDFRILRRGSGLDTKYSIKPADPDGGPSPMSEADIQLAEEKYDLASYVEPPSYEAWGKVGNQGGGSSKEVTTPAETSPFTRNRS